jgi:hypothetical protein
MNPAIPAIHLRLGPEDHAHVARAVAAIGASLAPSIEPPDDALVVVDPVFLARTAPAPSGAPDPAAALRTFAAAHPRAPLAALIGKPHPVTRPMLADLLEVATLTALVARDSPDLGDTLHALAHPPRFGLDRFGPSARFVSEVGAGEAREQLLDAVQTFLAAQQIRARMAAIAGDVIEELITNALYDAPVDATGVRLYADLDRRRTVALAPSARARLEVAVVGTTVYATMTDPHGSLEPSAVRRFLVDGLRGAISDKPGGAGLGFARVYGLVDRLAIQVVTRQQTEVLIALETGGARRDPSLHPAAFVATVTR